MLGLIGVVRRMHRSLRPAERLLLLWAVAVSVLLGIMLTSAQTEQDRDLAQQTANRERALAQMRADVTKCFLSPGRLDPKQVGYCEARFDDPATTPNDYHQVQASTASNLALFRDLIKLSCVLAKQLRPATSAEATEIAKIRKRLCTPPATRPPSRP